MLRCFSCVKEQYKITAFKNCVLGSWWLDIASSHFNLSIVQDLLNKQMLYESLCLEMVYPTVADTQCTAFLSGLGIVYF